MKHLADDDQKYLYTKLKSLRQYSATVYTSVIFVNENENENDKDQQFVHENEN